MDEHENDYVLAFDHFYTNNHIQIMKALLPFLNTDTMPWAPVLIKYMELKYTLQIVQQGQKPVAQISGASTSDNRKDVDIEKIYNSIKSYLSPSENQSIKQILNLIQTMKNMKEMQQMVELFQSFNSDTPDISDSNNTSDNSFDFGEIMELINTMSNQ